MFGIKLKNKYVDFVSDEHFLRCVGHVCSGYFEIRNNLKVEDLRDNGLDPFKTLFDIINRKMSFENWLKTEEGRQYDKTLNNRIGEFHQKMLGGVKGWKDLGTGDETKLDLIKTDLSIGIELKNKFNTVNADSLNKVRDKLEQFVIINKGSVGYWAYIIEKDNSSGVSSWNKKDRTKDKNIRKIWGAKVYELVTKDKQALSKTWKALPKAISDYFNGKVKISEEDMKKLSNLFVSSLQ